MGSLTLVNGIITDSSPLLAGIKMQRHKIVEEKRNPESGLNSLTLQSVVVNDNYLEEELTCENQWPMEGLKTLQFYMCEFKVLDFGQILKKNTTLHKFVIENC